MNDTNKRAILLIIAACMLTGCASDQARKLDQDIERFESAEEFAIRQAACRSSGGKMVIQGSSTRIRGKKFTQDRYKQAICSNE